MKGLDLSSSLVDESLLSVSEESKKASNFRPGVSPKLSVSFNIRASWSSHELGAARGSPVPTVAGVMVNAARPGDEKGLKVENAEPGGKPKSFILRRGVVIFPSNLENGENGLNETSKFSLFDFKGEGRN
mmetsp:Transcript_8429/g.18108  ORF Transcript_8429/g.18108 Transcript_8429/m.18108 type:complete len:130 (-) Transcript_8429:746-1135(-)